MKAWIENGIIRDICNGEPTERYHPDIAVYYDTEIPDGIVNGARQVNGVWVNPEAPLPYVPEIQIEMLKSQRLSELAAYRYQKETAGITLNGAAIKTDLESQAKINGAWSAAQMNPLILIDWKGANGWIQIDAATVTAIAMSVANHVQACFSNERVHAEAISAMETADAVQGYDITTGWPS